jgi:restriction system protein
MRNFYRIMLGQKSVYAQQCLDGGFIGGDFDLNVDLTNKLYENWRDFNHEFIPVLLSANPEKNKIAAGLACGALWTIAKGIQVGDTILSPNGAGKYLIGEVAGNYYYQPDGVLAHRRNVNWLNRTIDRQDMSDALRNSAGSIGTVSNVSKYAEEINRLIGGLAPPSLVAADENVEDPAVFALEKHLEEFLVQNWQQTELGKTYDIYQENGELVGQQYPSDTGPIDILAVSKDKREILVVELKKGRVSDVVVGQIQRYMGYVLQELAEANQTVKGAIIALDDDIRIRRALAVTTNIEFYRYQVSFKLRKA